MCAAVGNWFSDFIPRRFHRRRPRVYYGIGPDGRSNNRLPIARYYSPGGGGDVLTVRHVDLCLEQNGTDHRTKRFELMQRDAVPGETSQLVVRRGQPFRLRIACHRPFDRNRDSLSFSFIIHDENRPGQTHGSALKYNENNLGDPHEWGAALSRIEGDILDVLVKAPASAPVTFWRVEIDTRLNSGGARTFVFRNPIVILFNPWCPDDDVFLPDTRLLDEYVLGDTTLIWRGSYNRLRPSVWKLGQFDRYVLECALLVIAEVGKVSGSHRGNVVKVSRALAAAVNSPDDEGVVLGNWSEDFSGGVAPTKWVGSVEILQKFYKKRKPVKYGQCWIFAGVLTTIARALGIPSRIITNYASAHDTHSSMTVDYFVNEEGKVMEELNSDSIWNYHVWNEVWMERSDLGYGPSGDYGGWQVVDATPQELSDQMYRCGPAPVKAVKMGEITKPYDCDFVYSEVNADKLFWRYAGVNQPLKLIRKDVLGIGHFISTKAVGEWKREDITKSYKFDEKTDEERATMLKALKQANSVYSRYYLNEDFNDVHFNFELRDDIVIGQNFTVVLEIKNKSSHKTHFVTGSLHIDSVHYTGKHRESIKIVKFERELKPGSMEVIRDEVVFNEYYGRLLDQSAFNISCLASVKDTEFDYFAQDDFRVRKPDIKITFQGNPVSREPVDVIIRLKNPLPMPLKKGVFHVEGTGLDHPQEFKIAEVPIDGTAAATFKYTPPYAGRGALAAKFTSKELDDVDGFLAFETQPRPEDVLMSNGSHPRMNEVISRRDVIP
ncbi:annulin isoform X2 [Lutzomyia longipalpis]|uniref:annulin isoform X2 n=1 Tax=Lutzomyia longipalpis TaxID=7200 RepID=UPI002483D2EF|nr:annulin isoform X2 [Lutzomyia longipalpis]